VKYSFSFCAGPPEPLPLFSSVACTVFSFLFTPVYLALLYDPCFSNARLISGIVFNGVVAISVNGFDCMEA
jgi:hypothetical protein